MKRSTQPRRSAGRRARWPGALLRSEEGLTLVEVLIAAAILLIVAVGILPLFTRALMNNIAGYDSSQVTSHSKSEEERIYSVAIDHPIFDMQNPPPDQTVQPADPTGDEMILVEDFWDQGPASDTGFLDEFLGDEGWITDPALAQGKIFWRRTHTLRQYSYADISEGVIDVTDPGALTTLGHPRLFDRPLEKDVGAAAAQLKQQEVTLTTERAGGELGIGNLRTQFFRTY